MSERQNVLKEVNGIIDKRLGGHEFVLSRHGKSCLCEECQKQAVAVVELLYLKECIGRLK